MHDIFIYIIKWATSLAVLYIPFALLMRKETFSSFNRALLLCIQLAAMLLPLIEVEIPIEVDKYIEGNIIGALESGTLTVSNNNIVQAERGITLWQILFIIY